MNNQTNVETFYHDLPNEYKHYCTNYIKAVQNYNNLSTENAPDYFQLQAEILRLRIDSAKLDLYQSGWMVDFHFDSIKGTTLLSLIDHLNKLAA